MSAEMKENKAENLVLKYINEKTPAAAPVVSEADKDHSRTMLNNERRSLNTPLAAEEDDSLEGDPPRGSSGLLRSSEDTLPLSDHKPDHDGHMKRDIGDRKDHDDFSALIDQYGPLTPLKDGDEVDGVHVGSRAGDIDDWGSQVQEKADWYQRKKIIAQGMMDLALFSANANQLRYVLDSNNNSHPYYYFSLVLISLSIILQVVVGIAMVLHSQCDVNDSDQKEKAHKANDATVLGVFLITVINVFISSFSVSATTVPVATGAPVTP